MYNQLLNEFAMLRAGLGYGEVHLTTETPVWAVLTELEEMKRNHSGRKRMAIAQLHKNIAATIK